MTKTESRIAAFNDVRRRQELTISDYYYRVDPEKRINLIKDGVLRARYWQPGHFPHENLDQISKNNPNDRVYRVCFYDTETFARDRLREFSSDLHVNYGDGVQMLTRWPRNAPSSKGFTHSQDDGFNPGDASLYWLLEKSGDELSSIGIALSLAEVWDNAQNIWVPLFDKYPSLDPNPNVAASKTQPTGSLVKAAPGSGVDESEKGNGRLKRCMDWLRGKLSRR